MKTRPLFNSWNVAVMAIAPGTDKASPRAAKLIRGDPFSDFSGLRLQEFCSRPYDAILARVDWP
jgi:hypothetical protein